MLKEALEYLYAKAHAINETTIIPLPGGDGRDYLEVAGGVATRQTAAPEPVVYTVGLLSDLAMLALAPPFTAPNRILSYGHGWAKLHFDRDRLGSYAEWRALKTAEYTFFSDAEFSDGVLLSVKEAVKTFDLLYPACVPDARFLERIGKLSTKVEEVRQAAVNTTSTMANDLRTQEATGVEFLPNKVETFRVKPWLTAELPMRLELPVRIKPDLDRGEWLLLPGEEGLAQFRHAATEMIRNYLASIMDQYAEAGSAPLMVCAGLGQKQVPPTAVCM